MQPSSPRFRPTIQTNTHTLTHAGMNMDVHTNIHVQNHSSTDTAGPLPLPTQQARQYIQGNRESVPSEIHRILFREGVIGNGPVSAF